MQQVLGGWSLSGITNIATGNPFTVYANHRDRLQRLQQLSRTARTSKVQGRSSSIAVIPTTSSTRRYFGKTDPNAFCPGSTTNKYANGCAPTGRVGTSPRNAYYGPGLISFDTTAAKTFRDSRAPETRISGRLLQRSQSHQFRRTRSRSRRMNNGAFGTLSSTSTFNNGDTGGPRVIQMTLRLQF